VSLRELGKVSLDDTLVYRDLLPPNRTRKPAEA
jgi:hypothetical protein